LIKLSNTPNKIKKSFSAIPDGMGWVELINKKCLETSKSVLEEYSDPMLFSWKKNCQKNTKMVIKFVQVKGLP
jgi:hypothetical protein